MSVEAGFTIGVVALTIVAIAREVYSPDVLLFGALVLLMAVGIIEPEAALASFGNPAVATVGALFVVAAGLRATGALEGAERAMLGGPRPPSGSESARLRRVLTRLTTSTAALSAFISNTPIVAMAVPTISGWADRNRFSPSKFLIPLSYASILGGVCTLIGTSTNLVSDGLLRAHELPGLGFFELAAVGVPCAVVGILYLIRFSPSRLADRVPIRTVGEDVRRYVVEMMLSDPSPLIGRTIEEAGLRHLPGLFLFRVERSTGIISPVGPEVRLLAGDRLTFAGVVETIVDLRNFKGLIPVAMGRPAEAARWDLHEAVVSPGSPLVGSNIREANFRGRYNAAVIAVHRHGERIEGRIGDIVLRPGDTLLLEAASGFTKAYRNSSDFYLVSRVGDSQRPQYDLAFRAATVLAAMVLLAAFDVLPIAVSALGASVAMVALGCLDLGEARRSVDWSVLITIGSALGIAAALEASGAAGVLAHGVIAGGSALGTPGVLAATLLGTMVLTEFISNTAAAAIMFPVALSAAGSLAVDGRPLVIAVTVAASLSLSTPIGYQTNLIVYGPGGYRFTDFARLGIPLQLLLAAVCLVLIPILWPF